ncbi:MAG: hypothetical protein V1751_02830 [Pseudomonadota bacterium]
MSKALNNGKKSIYPYMTILDVLSRYGNTDSVFREYDEEAGICLCCEALFDPLSVVAEKYNLNLEKLITELEHVINVG